MVACVSLFIGERDAWQQIHIDNNAAKLLHSMNMPLVVCASMLRHVSLPGLVANATHARLCSSGSFEIVRASTFLDLLYPICPHYLNILKRKRSCHVSFLDFYFSTANTYHPNILNPSVPFTPCPPKSLHSNAIHHAAQHTHNNHHSEANRK